MCDNPRLGGRETLQSPEWETMQEFPREVHGVKMPSALEPRSQM